MIAQREASVRVDAERRLALLATRLVQEYGPETARQRLLAAAQAADGALQRIAVYSDRVVAPVQQELPISRFGRRRERRIRRLAQRVESLVGCFSSSANGAIDRQSLNAPAASLNNADAEALQLFLLLAVSQQNDTAALPTRADVIGRELVSQLISERRAGRYFGAVVRRNGQSFDHLRRYPLALVLYSLTIVAYLLLRFRGHYVEQDTAEMTQLIQAVAAYGNAIPAAGVHPVYPSGFGFQAVNIYLMRLSGASVQTLEAWVWPFLLVGISLVAFLAFREITGDDRAAALGGLFLFMQPDFLFTALRGSHEKMTYCMLLAALFLLFRSYRFRHSLLEFSAHVVAFYIVLLGISCTNSTFGSSLIVALTISFFGGSFVTRLLGSEAGPGNRALIRLAYVSFSSFLVLFAELFYLYEPSVGIFNQFQSAMDRIAGFALSFESTTNPYAYISLGWRSTSIFLVLTTFSWLTIAISGIVWCRETLRFFNGGWRDAPDHVRLRWLLYAGLALQVGLGIGVDFAGVLGSNLQLRLFPVYMFLAIPAGSVAVVGVMDRVRRWPLLHQAMRLGIAVTTITFTAFSALKATNEPLLSNKWTFYSTTEAQAMDWLDAGIPQGAIWADIDERLREVDLFRSPPTEDAASRYPTLLLPEQVDVIMLSHITRERMARVGTPLPDLTDMNELYDNGLVQIYRQLPLTPLQH